MKQKLLIAGLLCCCQLLIGQTISVTRSPGVMRLQLPSNWVQYGPQQVAADDVSYAYTKSKLLNGSTGIVEFIDFGFSIPVDAVIERITSKLRRFKKGKNTFKDWGATLIRRFPGADYTCSYGAQMACPDNWTNTETDIIYSQTSSGYNDFNGNYQWTPGMINDPLFGFFFGASQVFLPGGGKMDVSAFIDKIDITVEYSLTATNTTKANNETLDLEILNGECVDLPSGWPDVCVGNNVTENFDVDGGSFSSVDFQHILRKGYWKASKVAQDIPISIESGVYSINQDGYINCGFTLDGANSITLEILDAQTRDVLFHCEHLGGRLYPRERDELRFLLCLRLPHTSQKIPEFYIGRKIIYKIYFIFRGLGNRPGTVYFDNFSTAGSATMETVTTKTSSDRTTDKISSVQKEIKVYPSPAEDQITILHPDFNKGGKITIINIEGKIMKTLVIGEGTGQAKLNVSNFPEGLYIVRFTNQAGISKTLKIVKE